MQASKIVKEARKSLGWSQRQLAGAAGVPHSTVARIESGVIDPRVSTVERLLRACGLQLRAESNWDSVDRSLIRENLKLTPHERLENAVSVARAAQDMRVAAQRAAS